MIPSAQDLEPIAKKYEIDLAVLFGSRATGRVHSESDWDIAVRSRRVLSLEERLELIGDI